MGIMDEHAGMTSYICKMERELINQRRLLLRIEEVILSKIIKGHYGEPMIILDLGSISLPCGSPSSSSGSGTESSHNQPSGLA